MNVVFVMKEIQAKQKKIRCKHNICKRCHNLINDKRCPLCRVKMIRVKSKYIVRI